MVESGRNSNSSKLLCISALPARMKKSQSKIKELDWPKHFSSFKSMEIFPDDQGQLTPQSVVKSGGIMNSSEILWCFGTYKNEEDPIKNEGARMVTTFSPL